MWDVRRTLVAACALLAVPPAARAAEFAFRDSVLTLSEVESLVVARNPTLAAGVADTREAAAAVRAAGAWQQPMAEGMLAPGTLGSEMGAAYRVQIEQPLPWFGPRGAQVRAARGEESAMRADAEAMRLDMLREVRETYAELYAATRIRVVTRELAGVMDAVRRSALTRYGSGLSESADPLMAQTEVTMLEHERFVAERRIRVAQTTLLTLLHLPLTTAVPPPPAALHDDMEPGGMVDSLLDAPPALHTADEAAAAARLAARQADADAARRMGRPMLSLGAAFDRFMPDANMRPAVMLSMSLPLWRGGPRADAAMADARADRARYELDAVRDRIALQAETAHNQLDEAAHEVEQLDADVLPLAERANRAALRSYEAGTGELSMVLESARALLRARVQRIEAERMARMAHAQLHRVWGLDSRPEEMSR